ncbi:MAG: tRNA (guanosine(37)-N1)-methyltransferase TrmD [Bacteroidota bacterium]|nr:tRNA (guanosine(37)-N1)-methyltransferase TrmD [Bacteroidota bacterium]MDP4232231.1 tRNA (guanosine(37)-N1)-methyltransferase TrmD [Bacteroidota bacterium]MDP4243589.1 tRNA (guanosine(37)-N1)-methyltransferase TrmD [Bacteroidota bacterium]MDP4289124.1 tRNA (guanosine(37)-N1)-methyltransferase TrmD [Bacteroidota bacterium]
MRIDIISAVPKLLESPLSESIIKRAREKGIIEIVAHDLREYGLGKYHQIDDEPFGGGAGMVLKPEPLFALFRRLTSERDYDERIFMSPDGEQLTQPLANELSMKNNLLILCGHYKGVDERVREKWITREITIGDYVLTGGELPACVLIDAVVRLIPGAIHDSESAMMDSFQNGLLEGPIYTRPSEFEGMRVPDILLNGDHAKIADYREAEAMRRTKDRRPDLLKDL